MSCGYVYIASNNVGGCHDYIREAVYSALSLRKVDASANIVLFTDKPVQTTAFNDVHVVDMALRCKQRLLLDSPFDKTVYIDTDTYINHDISDMFALLDRYDLLGCHDYARKRVFPFPEYMSVPYGFSEINGGVLAYKKSDLFIEMIRLWNKYYEKYRRVCPWDQPSLRIAAWESGISLYMLPPEFNRRSRASKDKCLRLRAKGDPRFGEDHLKTRIFHFHGIEALSHDEMNEKAQAI